MSGIPSRSKGALRPVPSRCVIRAGRKHGILPLLLSCLLVGFHACALLAALPARADEGMWPPYSLSRLPWDSLRAQGCELTPEQVYTPGGGGIAGAVVQVGATASFVSPRGLLVTNHHVVYSAVQEQSTPERNYVRDGFYAATEAEELPAPGYTVDVTTGIEDVTAQVLSGITEDMTGIRRFQAVDQAIKRIVQETEKGTDLRCRVVPMFGGGQYVRFTFVEIRDVRIVYAPPEAIGDFGGEIDNWMWPRHTGDFGFLRAYVGRDGRPAGYSEDNVPYKPRVFLPFSSAGAGTGDLTITIGFPGRTERYLSSFGLEDQVDFSLPYMIRSNQEDIAIVEGIARTDSAIALRAANGLKWRYNRLKKNRGVLEGLRRGRALERKREEERGLTEFLDANPALGQKYASVLPGLRDLYKERERWELHDVLLQHIPRASQFYDMASDIYRWAVEREKADSLRDRGFQARDTLAALRSFKTRQINLLPSVDRALMIHALQAFPALPPDQKVEALERHFAGTTGAERDRALAAFADSLYDRTRVGDLDVRLRMFHMSRQELEALHDPFIDLAAGLYPEYEKIRERDRAFEGDENRLEPMLVQAWAKWKDGAMYPDANGTMRVSFGQVRGYSPRDAVRYDDHTFLSGVMEKETGEEPFIVPEPLKAAWASRDFNGFTPPGKDDVPVDFLTTNDITNGNSGSPVLNGKGEIVGLAFDGNYESVASDYIYDPERNRTIAVDSRYILFLLEKVYRLDRLLRELTVH